MSKPVLLAGACAATVAAAAVVLSWDALSWSAVQVGVDPRIAGLWPIAVDGTIATSTTAVLALGHAPWRVRAYVWALLGCAVSVSIVGNAAHASMPDWLHRAGSAVPAAALAASLHTLIVLIRHQRSGETARVRAAVSATVSSGAPSKRRRVRRLLAGQPAITAGQAARQLGVPRSTAARWLSEARRPRVVEGQG